MKNLFKSVSACGNPAKFVWQNHRPGNNPDNIDDIKDHIVSDEDIKSVKNHIDTTKTTLAEVQVKLKKLNTQKKQIDKWAEQQKADWEKTQMMNEYSNNQLAKTAEENVNKKLMVLTTSNELALMAENGLSPQPGKTNREVLKPVLVQKEINNLKQIKKEQYYAQIEEMALNKRVALTTNSGESYNDLLLAENTLQRKYDEQKVKYEDMLAMKEFLEENDIDDPEYAEAITKARTEMIQSENAEVEALALEKAKNPFTAEQLGNSSYEMMKNIPGAQRQEAFKANFPEEDFAKFKYGRGLTGKGNKKLYDLLKSRV